MDKSTKKLTVIQEKRLNLSNLSRQADDLREKSIKEAMEKGDVKAAISWEFRTINSILLHNIYEINGATEFKTFNQWKQANATVKKGEKAFLIWGQPIKNGKQEGTEEPKTETEEKDKYRFFPLCFLFSDKQVLTQEERQKAKEDKQQIKEEKPLEVLEMVTDDIF
jgi:N-terminal domain of anti-restriction factor ArdC